jgi:hypothetical protein
MPHTRLHVHVSLTRRTSGRSCSLTRRSNTVSSQNRAPRHLDNTDDLTATFRLRIFCSENRNHVDAKPGRLVHLEQWCWMRTSKRISEEESPKIGVLRRNYSRTSGYPTARIQTVQRRTGSTCESTLLQRTGLGGRTGIPLWKSNSGN